ncbi:MULTISPECIES: histidine phosphatase family protein [Microbacterium]|uniref:histidine phosphatase family protein n=1 Tax=Microbacterium TaxID=33882 RepID=UPI0027877419|nr:MULTISPECIES: histidine phosphatase family protein [Microbacterium]MDQ1083123.1 broad specificity phosphatase PhoE [Microbacterium sp. SORGH_AS_0344]MDQ1171605.1 broad specificity phosphatase PhoE [Microbacterium proteolyticum]
MAVTRLWLIRHGESEGNVAASEADRTGSPVIALDIRDADVELSPTGRDQAEALGTWLRSVASDVDEYWVSPYRRARQTLAIALDDVPTASQALVDERLRDRELGILDLLTWQGVQELHPEEAARRRHLGKFFHRPPGGESWADVALRLRSFFRDALERPAPTVVVVAHDAVIMLILYILLNLDEAKLLAFAASHTVRNASVTELVHNDEGWKLVTFSAVDHLESQGADVTVHSGEDDV